MRKKITPSELFLCVYLSCIASTALTTSPMTLFFHTFARREEDVVDVDEVMREKGDKGSKKGSGSKANVSYVTTTSTFNQIFSVFDSHFPKGQEHLKGRNRGLMKSLTHGTPRDKHRGVYSVSDSSVSVSEEEA